MNAMTILHPALSLALLSGAQTPQRLTGTFTDLIVPEGGRAIIELKPSDAQGIPGATEGDRVFRVATPQFRPAGAPGGLLVAFVETRDGGFLFVDRNIDGRLTESERTPYTRGSPSPEEIQLDITPPGERTPSLPFKCSLTRGQRAGVTQYFLHFTASFRAEGYVDIGGHRTLFSLPFDAARGTVNIRYGKIGIDANGDGSVNLSGVSGPEVAFAKGEPVIMRVRDRFVSVESADFAGRTIVLREHRADEYTLIDVQVGVALPEFDFTDFDGRARKLSDFRGKHVLLDFWGSWCGPCVAALPSLKAAYDRFRDRGFEILGIDYERNASMETVRKLLEQKGVTWTNAAPDSVKDLVEKRFRIWGFPTYILLDPEGVVVETNGGRLRGQALIATLEQRLKR